MKQNFNGLTTVNIELTSRCNKSCWMCGRRKLEKLQQTDWGDMHFSLVKKIAKQLPPNIVVQFHSNGEPLLYPKLGDALSLFKRQIRCLDTNAKLLLHKKDEIINNLDTATISVIENDPEGDEQYKIVTDFLKDKGEDKPFMVYRLLGFIELIPNKNRIDVQRADRWYELPGLVATRVLHNAMGSFNYTKKVTIPEIGVCLDLLNHLLIDRYGNCYPCVRFNPTQINYLGNIRVYNTLADIWNSDYRKYLIEEHLKGNRTCSTLCKKCDFYGCPTAS